MENLETQRTNYNDPRGMESVDGYVSTLFFLSNTEKNVMQIKKRLMQYAEQAPIHLPHTDVSDFCSRLFLF